MIDCSYRRENECCLATQMAKAGTAASTTEAACAACLRTPHPRAPNAVTASLAITHAERTRSSRYRDVVAECRPLLKVESQSAEPTGNGAGTHLYRMLHRVGIRPCGACVAFANSMNEEGPQWCRQHEEEILQWLREQADRVQIPFVKTAARLIVQRAIAAAEKETCG